MLRGIHHDRRRGSILPLLVISLVAMLGMVALAIDLGMLAVARTHCQAAADAAALAGARTLTGDPATDFNRGAALGNAERAVAENQVIGRPIQSNQVKITIGSYRYDDATDRFVIDPEGRNAGDAWSLCQATVTSSNPAAFARIFNINMLNAAATATAAHRPRDVAVVIDFSGSMRLSSLLGAPITDSTGLNLTNRTRAQITENVFPRWGHYSAGSTALRGSTPGAPLLTASGEQIGPSNLVEATDNGPAVIESFFQDATPFGSSTRAFTRWPDAWQNVPDGLMPRYENGSTTTFAQNVNRVLGRSRDENDTARSTSSPFIDDQSSSSTTAGYGTAFRSYTAGPRYWGKTFFMWPPDPRGATSNTNVSANNGARDWRQRFFIQIYLGTTDSTSSSTSGGGSGGSGGSGGGSGGSGGGSGGGSPPPPPPPPLNMVPSLKLTTGSGNGGTPGSAPPPPIHLEPDAQSYSQFMSGTGLTVGTRQPLRINALMWNGVTNLSLRSGETYWDPKDRTKGTMVNRWGDGLYRTPGNRTAFTVFENSTSVTNSDGSVTTTTRRIQHHFVYQVNYDAILAWLKEDPQPFPPRMRAGGIVYYTYIPNTIRTDVHPIPTDSEEHRNQRFWKEYIDQALGIEQWGFETYNGIRYARYNYWAGRMGYGEFFGWGARTMRASIAGMENLTPRPQIAGSSLNLVPNNIPQFDVGHAEFDSRYMNYRDNPARPRLQFWFSPMTLVDFLNNMNINPNRNWLPGTIPEAPMWQAKAGVQAAIGDIRNNHPNDLISLIAFSQPEGFTPTQGSQLRPGSYNSVLAPLSREYRRMQNALYFPTLVVNTNTEIHPYHPAISQVPRAIGGTCYAMGLMLAYNQFARPVADSELRTFAAAPALYGQAGGLGRRGAQKMVIFQTDGVCSSTAYPPGGLNSIFQNQGPYRSYFRIRYDAPGSPKNEYPPYVASGADEAATQALAVTSRLCEPDTALGFSTRRKPVRVHTLAFGSLFEAGGNTTEANKALSLLQQMQFIGGVQDNPSTPLANEKIIVGSANQRIERMRTAFSNIMQDGHSVTLID